MSAIDLCVRKRVAESPAEIGAALEGATHGVPAIPSIFVRRGDLRLVYGGSEQVAREVTMAGLLKPICRRKGLTLFRLSDAVAAGMEWERQQEVQP